MLSSPLPTIWMRPDLSLKLQGAAINSWGVGTNLITSKDCPSFGGVYKLAAIQDKATGNSFPEDQAVREC